MMEVTVSLGLGVHSVRLGLGEGGQVPVSLGLVVTQVSLGLGDVADSLGVPPTGRRPLATARRLQATLRRLLAMAWRLREGGSGSDWMEAIRFLETVPLSSSQKPQ